MNLPLFVQGKVRDVYDLGDKLLIVSSDRISAFDVVLPTTIPDKGKILNQISLFWFNQIKGIVNHHGITGEIEEYPETLQPVQDLERDGDLKFHLANPVFFPVLSPHL